MSLIHLNRNRLMILLAFLVSTCGGNGAPQGSPPQIQTFSPMAGSAGTQVTIQGILFAETASGNTVRFNDTAATVLSASATTLAVVVPAGARTGRISVTTSGGTGTSPADFSILSGQGSAWTTRLSGPPRRFSMERPALAHQSFTSARSNRGRGPAPEVSWSLWTTPIPPPSFSRIR